MACRTPATLPHCWWKWPANIYLNSVGLVGSHPASRKVKDILSTEFGLPQDGDTAKSIKVSTTCRFIKQIWCCLKMRVVLASKLARSSCILKWLGIFYNIRVCHQQAWSTLWLFSLDPSEPEHLHWGCSDFGHIGVQWAARWYHCSTAPITCQVTRLEKKTIVWHVSLSTSSGAWRSEVTITVKNALMQLMLIILATSPRRAKQSDICRQSLLLYSLSCWPCMPFYMSLGYMLHGRNKNFALCILAIQLFHSFIYLIMHSFIHPFFHSFIHSFIHSSIHLFIHWIYMLRDHMGCWQSSWWLYTWGGITWDSGSPAGGYTHGVGSHGILAIQLVAIYRGMITWDSGSPACGYIHGEGSHGILAIKLVAR